MTLKEKLQKAWENRAQIAEGFYHLYVSSTPELEQESQRRLDICRSNKCGYYDKDGTTEKVVEKGREACGGCGCRLDMKSHCYSCQCYLGDIGQQPLWEAYMTQEQEKSINEIEYKKQFEKPNNK